MILEGTEAAGGNHATFDDLFRRAGVQRADALALVDPPDGERLTGRAPLKLTYTQADRAISALAAKLRALGLQTDTVVAIQLANSVESIIAMLGVMRAGMIAVPLPLLWRRQEIVAALSSAGAKAIVTATRIGASAAAETAMQVAVELFPIRHICSFGRDLPDGVVPLDDCLAPGADEFFQPAVRPGDAAAHIAAITFDVTADGLTPVMRSQNELLAAGFAAFQQGDMAQGGSIVSTIPLGSFAGMALTVVPWLLAGGTLALAHGFEPAVFEEQCRAHGANTVVLPGPALGALAEAGLLGGSITTILALWRAPEKLAAAPPWQRTAALVDIVSLGETAMRPARRGPNGLPVPIPQGAANSATGLTVVGGYRFRQSEVDAAVAAVDPAAVIVALPDALLGQRLAGSARDGATLAAELRARGVNALIAGAFRPRTKAA
jgi:non-ribosomal peptide synthetase component F